MSRPRHPDKAIEKAVKFAEGLGWNLNKSSGKGHTWGILYCPLSTRDGCKIGVYCTPRDGDNHAKHIRREVNKCQHLRATNSR